MNIFAPSSAPPSSPFHGQARGPRDGGFGCGGGCEPIAPEVDSHGGVEYKLHLANPSEERLEKLATQLKWRLDQGGGVALYILGVSDGGDVVGLHRPEFEFSIANMQRIASRAGARIGETKVIDVHGDRRVAQVSISSNTRDGLVDVRVALIGVHRAGKSSLLGALCHGVPDNGRGRARLSLLRHRHEIETGHTSSIAREVLGFDAAQPVTYASTNVSSWEDIVTASEKAVVFHDCPGKSTKTLIRGLWNVDYAALVVPADSGHVDMQHLLLLNALEIPFSVVFTKIDAVTKANLRSSLEQVLGLLKHTHALFTDAQFTRPRFFFTSAVSGSGIPDYMRHLSGLPVPPRTATCTPAVFGVEETFHGGSVLSGFAYAGVFSVGDTVYLSPTWEKSTIDSIHRHRLPVGSFSSSATLRLSSVLSARRGAVLAHQPRPACVALEMRITWGSYEGEGFVYVGGIKALARTSGSIVTWSGEPEVVVEGMKVLLVDLAYAVQCVGVVVDVKT